MGNLGFQELLLLVVLASMLLPGIFYLITLQNALKTVKPKNRRMQPGSVWVMFVPVLNAIFLFFIVNAVSMSFQREYEGYGIVKTSRLLLLAWLWPFY